MWREVDVSLEEAQAIIGAGVVALAELAAFMIPSRPRVTEAAEPELGAVPELAYEAEAA